MFLGVGVQGILVIPLPSDRMALNYETPDKRPPRPYGLWGAIAGAVGLPGAFVIVAIVGNDAGGPCFWPIALVIGAGLGWVAGTVIGAFLRRSRKGAG